MEITVTGLNHKRAPVELREKLAVDEAVLPTTLAEMRKSLGAAEMVILSTCNRVELYSVHEGEPPPLDAVAAVLGARHVVAAAQLAPALYRHAGADAVRHLFRVSAGLDSMVLGEPQILGQVKEAYNAAREAGATGRVFNRLFQKASSVAGRIRSTTSIGEKNVSVPSVASRLAEKVFQDLARKRLIILGAGEMGELTVGAFRHRGVTRIHVVNRTLENARALAERYGGQAHTLDELPQILPQGDIVIACIRSETYVLTVEHLKAALEARRHDPIFLIDISVPRNIHPEVNEIDNVYLFNIDDLESIVQQNRVEREREVARCMPLVEEETGMFLKELMPPDVTALLTQLREALQAIGDEETKRTLAKLDGLPPDQSEEVREMARRMINKVHHLIIELIRKLLRLNR